MVTFGAREAKNEFGRLLDTVQREAVTIEKKGRPVAIIMSMHEYKRLEELEDELWAARAKAAEAEGFAGIDASENFLKLLCDDAA